MPDADDITLDFDVLTNKNVFRNVEQVHLNGSGANTLRIDLGDVLNMTGTLEELLVTGDAGVDAVVTSDGWTNVGGTTDTRSVVYSDGSSELVTFSVYTLSNSAAQLLVESDIVRTGIA